MSDVSTPPRMKHSAGGQEAHDADQSTISLHAASPMLEGVSANAMNMIPVSLSRRLEPTPHPGAPSAQQTLLSASPLCIQEHRVDGCDTGGVPKRFAWDTVTPAARNVQSQPTVGGVDSAAVNHLVRDHVRELFRPDAEAQPTPAGRAGASPGGFLKAMAQLPLEESLQYLVQSDLAPPDQRDAPAERSQQEQMCDAAAGEAPSPLEAMHLPMTEDHCRYSESQQAFMYHVNAALKHVSEAEAQRLMAMMNLPSKQACEDALSSICQPVRMAPPPQHAPPAGGAPPISFAPAGPETLANPFSGLMPMPPAPGGEQLGPGMPGAVPPLRLDTLANVALSSWDTCSTRPSNVSSQPYSVHASPRIARAATMTPRKYAEAGDARPAPVPRGAITDRPAARQRTKKRPHPDMEYGSALLDRMQEEQRAARKRSAKGDGGLASRIASPRRRKSGPPSSRDKVWDLLHAEEKEQILRDEMSAAEGTKALLTRRSRQLGLAIVDMPDEDDWEIGFRLTECKATSEPLTKPKNCSICLRNGMVFHRHSYYCRRCAQLYRAIHRKKTNLQAEQAGTKLSASQSSGPLMPDEELLQWPSSLPALR